MKKIMNLKTVKEHKASLTKGDLVTVHTDLVEDEETKQRYFKLINKDNYLGIIVGLWDDMAKVQWIRHPSRQNHTSVVRQVMVVRVEDGL
jgi:hypothetical protein